MSKNYKNLDKIGFFGNIAGSGTNHGYGYTAVQLIESWQRQLVPVWWADPEAPIGFNFVQPHGYNADTDQIHIGYTPWESTKVPEAWPYYMNKMDEIWTTSQACKDWYEHGGIEVPVRVLHHGLNREHFPAKRRSYDGSVPFRFLHIGEPAPRKGGQMVYEVFKEEFGDREDVLLILKGNPRFEIDCSNVRVIDVHLSQEALKQLYHACHAFLYPTNGEGFGLLPFQAAATGMPTAVTNWGGCLDYINHCTAISLQDIVETNYEPHEGLWALPDKQNLKEIMWEFFEHKELSFEWAFENSLDMDAYWSWDSLGKLSLNWFQELLNR